MCLEVKKQKAKNKWFTWKLKCSKKCTGEVLITDWNKKRKRRPRKMYGWWFSQIHYNNESTEESFSGYKK